MSYFIQQLINSIAWGGIIAIISAGYTLTFGVIGLVNFAHGEIMMIGAMSAFLIMTLCKLPFWMAAIAAVAGSILIGIAVEKTAFKPIRGADMITLFITSLGASIIIRNSTIMLFSDKLKSISLPPFLQGNYELFDVLISKRTIVIFLASIIICAALIYLVKKTKLGIAMRSISYNINMSQRLGINTEQVISLTFIISSALAGIGAILWSISYGSVQASMGADVVVLAFVASVIGGVGNVFGAMVGGYLLAVGGHLFVAYLPLDMVGLRPLFVWIVFFALLILKPSGLFRANIQ